MIHGISDTSVAERIEQVRRTLPAHVRLIAVTKNVSVSDMRAAYTAGIRDFGESRVQEAKQKRSQLQDLEDITWHLIGHLQRNKAKPALELFRWIHSVDSLALAQRLNQLAATLHHPPQVCLQVKLLSDPNKYGWSAKALRSDLATLQTLDNLQIQGLMTILPMGLEPHQALQVFQQTCTLAADIKHQSEGALPLSELSMGMSGDYPLAIEAGATMVRLGRCLFSSG